MKTFKKETNLLCVDTSSRVLSVAVRARGKPLFEVNFKGALRHSECLIDAIRGRLSAAKLKKEDLNCFLWGLGPGSFTGLRIGLAVLKGFSLGLPKKKAFGVSSLDLIALGADLSSGKLIICVDARRERLYGAVYRFEHGEATRLRSDCLWTCEEFLHEIEEGAFLTGDGLESYGDAIRNRFGRSVTFLDASLWFPKASGAVQIWNEKQQWLTPLSLRTMIPKYLRRSEAEEKRFSQRSKAI